MLTIARRVRVFWPSTIEVSLGSRLVGECCDEYYQKVEQSLRLLESGDYTDAGRRFDPCGDGDFGSCNVSIQDRNDNRTMLASSPAIALNHSMTYTLQARFSDKV